MKKIYLFNFVIVIFILSFCANTTFALEKNTDLRSNEKNSIIPLDNKYGWNSIIEWKQSREKFRHELKIYELYREKKQSHLANCLKSVLAPGWGHFSAKSYTKGEILLGLQILLAGSSLYFYDKAMDSYDKYKTPHYQIDKMQQYYTDANSSYRTSQILLGFCAIVWGYTILDVIQATENYNRNLWEKLKLEYKDVELSITLQGISIQF